VVARALVDEDPVAMAPPKNAPAEPAARAAADAPAAAVGPSADSPSVDSPSVDSPSVDSPSVDGPPVGGVASLAFEEALARLEGVVTRLEKGDLSLEQSLSAYEEGVRLVAAARGRLEGLQGRLEQLLADGTTAPLPRPTAAAERGPS
jgi:exodeoxyribonuclease VII small subunit